MSDITFECPHCEKVSTVPASFAGKRGKCPSCKQVIEVPDPYADAESVGGPVEGPGSKAPSSSGGASDTRECPFCYETIKRGAKKCKHCGEYLDKRLRRTNRLPLSPRNTEPDVGPVDWVLCIFCPLIGCIIGIVALMQGHTKRGGTMIGTAVFMTFIWNVISFVLRAGAR